MTVLQTSYSCDSPTATSHPDRRLLSITHQTGNGTQLSRHDYRYAADGNLSSWTQTAGSGTPRVWQLQHDAIDQLTGVVAEDASGSVQPAASHFYGYDAAGNRTRQQHGLKVSQQTHNAMNQLSTRSSGGPAVLRGRVDEPAQVSVDGKGVLVGADKTFQTMVDVPAGGTKDVTLKATDASGNSTTQVWRLNAQAGLGFPSPCEYDADGNMTARYEFQADGTVKVRRYEWDDNARLTAVTVGAEVSSRVPAVGALRTEWTYDVSSRRVREVTKTRTATATWTTDRDVRYLWDGTEIIQERDTATNAVLVDYYAAGEVRFNPSTINSQGGFAAQPSTLYYTRDHLGSVREVIDATGTVRARYDYDPYGVRTKLSGDLDTPTGYTGHRYHESSGLHLALYRAYDAELGRWISEDPIGEEGGVNLYGYVGGSVIADIDPLGLWSFYKWLYTGDGNSDDSYYQEVLEVAAEAMTRSWNRFWKCMGRAASAIGLSGGAGAAAPWALGAADNLPKAPFLRRIKKHLGLGNRAKISPVTSARGKLSAAATKVLGRNNDISKALREVTNAVKGSARHISPMKRVGLAARGTARAGAIGVAAASALASTYSAYHVIKCQDVDD